MTRKRRARETRPGFTMIQMVPNRRTVVRTITMAEYQAREARNRAAASTSSAQPAPASTVTQPAPTPLAPLMATSSEPHRQAPSYGKRREKELGAWSNIRSELMAAYVEEQSLPCNPVCWRCSGALKQIYRCPDCNPAALLCSTCVETTHVVPKLHIVYRWTDNLAFIPDASRTNKIFPRPCHTCPSVAERKVVTLIDKKGRTHHGCTLHVCGCESVTSTMLRLGYWPLSPTAPTTAVSLDLLRWHTYLTLDCQVSASAFVSCLKSLQAEDVASSSLCLDRLLRGESLAEWRVFHHKMNKYPQKESDVLCCPACPQEKGSVFISLDGNFGLVHKTKSGTSYDEPKLGSMAFLPQEDVDNYVTKSGAETKKGAGECSTFQAGNVTGSKNKAAKLNFTGVFAAACRHEVPLKALNLRHGERIAYPVLMVESLVDQYKDKDVQLHILYDIACVLKAHLLKNQREDLTSNAHFAIPVFHSYGHKGECQVTLNPRRLDGFGLNDGEQLERLWSYLRLFSRITKEQSHGHRHDLLTLALIHYADKKIALMHTYLLKKLTRAEAVVSSAKNDLQKLFSDSGAEMPSSHEAQSKHFQQWAQDEQKLLCQKRTIKNITVDSADSMSAYSKKLQVYYNVRDQMSASGNDDDNMEKFSTHLARLDKELTGLEATRGIRNRWQPSSPEFLAFLSKQEHKRRLLLIYKLRLLCIDRKHLVEAKKNHIDGQSTAKRYASLIKAATSSLQKQMAAYNDCSIIGTGTLPDKLEWADIIRPEADIYKLLEAEMLQNESGLPSAEASTTLRRKAIETWSLINRAIEEESLVRSDFKNLASFYSAEHERISSHMSISETSSPRHLAGVRSICAQRLAQIELKLEHVQSAAQSFSMDIGHIPANFFKLFSSRHVSEYSYSDSDDSPSDISDVDDIDYD